MSQTQIVNSSTHVPRINVGLNSKNEVTNANRTNLINIFNIKDIPNNEKIMPGVDEKIIKIFEIINNKVNVDDLKLFFKKEHIEKISHINTDDMINFLNSLNDINISNSKSSDKIIVPKSFESIISIFANYDITYQINASAKQEQPIWRGGKPKISDWWKNRTTGQKIGVIISLPFVIPSLVLIAPIALIGYCLIKLNNLGVKDVIHDTHILLTANVTIDPTNQLVRYNAGIRSASNNANANAKPNANANANANANPNANANTNPNANANANANTNANANAKPQTVLKQIEETMKVLQWIEQNRTVITNGTVIYGGPIRRGARKTLEPVTRRQPGQEGGKTNRLKGSKYERFTVEELKTLLKNKGVKNYSKLKKTDLIILLTKTKKPTSSSAIHS